MEESFFCGYLLGLKTYVILRYNFFTVVIGVRSIQSTAENPVSNGGVFNLADLK